MSYLPHATSGSRGRSSSGASAAGAGHTASYHPYENSASRMAILEADNTARNREIETLRVANRQQKDRYEQTIADLLNKNKQLMGDASGRVEQADREVQLAQEENGQLRNYIRQLEDQVSGGKQALGTLESHTNNQSMMHRQLLSEVEELRRHVQVVEREKHQIQKQLVDAEEREEDLRCDLQDAQGKLERAGEHIKLLSDEAADAKMQLLRNENELEDIRAERAGNIALQNEVQERLCRAVFALSEEMEEVLTDCDELSLKTRLALKEASIDTGVAGSPIRSPTSTTQEVSFLQQKLEAVAARRASVKMAKAGGGGGGYRAGEPVAPPPPPRCLPSDIFTPADLIAAPPAALLKTTMSIMDVLALARDDIAVTLRAVDEEGVVRSRSTIANHIQSFRQAVEEERENATSAIQQLHDAEDRIRKLTHENSEMKISMSKVDSMMREADTLSGEQAQYLEAAIHERDTLQATVDRLVSEGRDVQGVIKDLERRVEELKDELTTTKWLANQKQQDAVASHAETQQAKASLVDGQAQIQALHSSLRDVKRDLEDQQRSNSKLNEVINDLKRKLHTVEAQLSQKAREVETHESRSQELEEQISMYQRQLDSAFRTSSGTSAVAMLGSGASVSRASVQTDRSLAFSPAAVAASPSNKVMEWTNRLDTIFHRAHSARRERGSTD